MRCRYSRLSSAFIHSTPFIQIFPPFYPQLQRCLLFCYSNPLFLFLYCAVLYNCDQLHAPCGSKTPLSMQHCDSYRRLYAVPIFATLIGFQLQRCFIQFFTPFYPQLQHCLLFCYSNPLFLFLYCAVLYNCDQLHAPCGSKTPLSMQHCDYSCDL